MQAVSTPMLPEALGLAFARTLTAAAAAVIAYVATVALWRYPIQARDLVAVAAIAVVSFAGMSRFAGISVDVALRLALRCVLLMLLGGVHAIAAEGPGILRPLADGHLVAWGFAAFSAVLGVHISVVIAARLPLQLRRSRDVVIVGVNEASVRLAEAIRAGCAKGERLVGYFDDRSPERTGFVVQCTRLGGLAELGAYARQHELARIYLALPLSWSPRLGALLRQTQESTASVYFVPDLKQADTIQCRLDFLADLPLLAVYESPLGGAAAVAKRALDLTVTLLALPLLLPTMGVIAVLVRCGSPGPALFKQRRYGLDGREIEVWKFRTMTVVEDGLASYTQTVRGDSRVTPLGRFLRASSLDELPQFLNVLAGDMSIVGPRPLPLAVSERCRQLIPLYMLRHKVKPGITGWAQVNGWRGGDDLPSLTKRTECDLQYLRCWSLWLDLVIIWRTALLFVRGDQQAF